MPKEFEALKAEFVQHENIMKELEKQAQEYRNEDKREAADRLEQQIVLLKVRTTFIIVVRMAANVAFAPYALTASLSGVDDIQTISGLASGWQGCNRTIHRLPMCANVYTCI